MYRVDVDSLRAYIDFDPVGRGVAKRRKGDIASGDADIAAAQNIKANVADDMAKMGVHL